MGEIENANALQRLCHKFSLLRNAVVMPRESGHPVITVDSVGHSLGLTIIPWLLAFPPARGMTLMGELSHFLRILLCGLRLPMRPLSLPAAGSITALIRVGLPESMASFTARFRSSGVVTLTPTPPKASIILS